MNNELLFTNASTYCRWLGWWFRRWKWRLFYQASHQLLSKISGVTESQPYEVENSTLSESQVNSFSISLKGCIKQKSNVHAHVMWFVVGARGRNHEAMKQQFCLPPVKPVRRVGFDTKIRALSTGSWGSYRRKKCLKLKEVAQNKCNTQTVKSASVYAPAWWMEVKLSDERKKE